MLVAPLLLLSALASSPQEPLRIGVLAVDDRASADVTFLRGARFAVEAVNGAGGGAKLELVVQPARTDAEVATAVAALRTAGVAGVVAPMADSLAAALDKAVGHDLPVLRYGAPSAAVIAVVDRLLERHLCMTRVGLVRDAGKPSQQFAKALAAGLSAPARVLWDLDVKTSAKKVQKQFAEERPEILVFDTSPEAAKAFLDEMLPGDPIPVVLLPRSYGAELLTQPRTVFVVEGLSASQTTVDSTYRRDYDRSNGVMGFGAAEGYEAVAALARAFGEAGSREAAAVQKALQSRAIEGVRGAVAYDAALGAFAAPLGVWIFEDDRLMPYTPLVVPLGAAATAVGDQKQQLREPQSGIGKPFGTWRTRQFAFDEGAQWVLCQWADDGVYDTGAQDLELLGLSTGGKVPVVDHLVREEILARVCAITSTKYLRNEDGTAIAGKSFGICFGVHCDEAARKKKKTRLWPARFGGDHPDAGGEAFGTFCRVYSMFIRRTIFQKNALQLALTAADRPFLDGTYVFGTDYDKDARSEKIRALINSYAGSMALTLAHEVGHLAGLGHVTDDPAEIMNVDEGAGIDYPEAHFAAGSLRLLEQQLGIVGATSAKKKH